MFSLSRSAEALKPSHPRSFYSLRKLQCKNCYLAIVPVDAAVTTAFYTEIRKWSLETTYVGRVSAAVIRRGAL
jgi:hypothetical protein